MIQVEQKTIKKLLPYLKNNKIHLVIENASDIAFFI